jgi:hypothetical protein
VHSAQQTAQLFPGYDSETHTSNTTQSATRNHEATQASGGEHTQDNVRPDTVRPGAQSLVVGGRGRRHALTGLAPGEALGSGAGKALGLETHQTSISDTNVNGSGQALGSSTNEALISGTHVHEEQSVACGGETVWRSSRGPITASVSADIRSTTRRRGYMSKREDDVVEASGHEKIEALRKVRRLIFF